MNARLRILPIAVLGTLLLGGCLGSPRIETSVYEGAQGSLALSTDSDASYRPAHPADVPVETFEQVLTGIHYRQAPGRWLQRLLDGGSQSSPLLSPAQVAFWAPHLRRAFLQATPEERVMLHIPLRPATKFQSLTGNLAFKENDLHMTLTLSGSSGRGLQSKTKPRHPESMGVTKSTVTFLPKSALKTSWNEGTGTNLTIDMAVFAARDGSVSKDSPSTTPIPDAAPRRVAPPVIPPDRPIIRLETPPSEKLLEEIRSLRRELSRQQQEIERLKKQGSNAP